MKKIHQICWLSGYNFHLPVKKCRNLCIPKQIWRFLEKIASVLCAKATIEHAASGWCAAVIFWKKSTRFAGFLVVIFTSQTKNLQKFMCWKSFCGIFEKFVVFVAFHCTDWLSSPKEVIFMKKIHQICWFSSYDFHLPVKKSSEIYAFRKQSGDFLKNLLLFCVPKLL